MATRDTDRRAAECDVPSRLKRRPPSFHLPHLQVSTGDTSLDPRDKTSSKGHQPRTGIGIPVLPSRVRRRPSAPTPIDSSRGDRFEAVDQWEVSQDSLRSPPRAVTPRDVGDARDLSDPALFFNRELSWLDFNWRVLHQARDLRLPLFERVRFLSITQSNLDEFVRKRVGGLQRQVDAGVTERSPDGRTPREQLDLIRGSLLEMQEAMTRTWDEHLVPALRREGLARVHYDELSMAERRRLETFFMEQIYPILTPLAVDRGHPFPFISNQSLSLAVLFKNPKSDEAQFARVKVPVQRGRWIPVNDPVGFLPLEELVARHVHQLFRGTRVLHVHPFRLSRNMDTHRDDEDVEDLLQTISEELRDRRFAEVVRLEVDAEMPRRVVDLLREELELLDTEVHRVRGLIDFTDVARLKFPERPDLWFPPWEPVTPPALMTELAAEQGIFGVLREQDILVHHPYDSFATSVQRFVEEAARDPGVAAIKLTLYRTSENSPILGALMRAAEAGKQVAVLVEVMARLDEAANIEWGQQLERAGVHVTYGLVGLKTHTKVCLVVRDEGGSIRTYSHIGTGNYHATTARLYTDLGLLTADPDIGMDLVRLFHYLTGHAPEQHYRSLIIAPRDMRRTFRELIDREIAAQKRGGSGRIILKMNAIDDVELIQHLYRASREGVQIDLIVRGHSRLRPGVPGVSENIRIVSIIGRFLEHDRIFCFMNDGEPEVLIGSSDWRRRNLEARVEALVRINDATHRTRLLDLLDLALSDNRLAWDLDSQGGYTQRRPSPGEEVRSYHDELMRSADQRRRMTEGLAAPSPAKLAHPEL